MDSVEENLLTEYINDVYPDLNGDIHFREEIRQTYGFQIHILSHYRRDIAKAVKDRMHKAQEQFIKIILGR